MTSRALISKIHRTLSANQSEIVSSMYNNKHSMTGPEGNSEICFPRISIEIEIRGKQNLLFPKGPGIKGFVIEQKWVRPVENK